MSLHPLTAPNTITRRLTVADSLACLALSTEASWNQTADDWAMILEGGIVKGTFVGGTLAATCGVLRYGEALDWICMVLVAKAHRRQGHATRLMTEALAMERAGSIAVGLDATPDGRKVYRKLGFADTFTLTRLAGAAPPPPSVARAPSIRQANASDLDAIIALDASHLGAPRPAILAALLARAPHAAFVLTDGGAVTGFVLGRDGRLQSQIGPVIAPDDAAAKALIGAALSGMKGPVIIDLVDGRPALDGWLESLGFIAQRPFTRMMKGAPPSTAAPVAVAGPELG
ncbi:MAG: GNAT family N-acetyltransferase [Pseudomonadota bacterium]